MHCRLQKKNQIARDYIYACPRVPLDRINFEFIADTDGDVNNFATAPGFQFAYQNIYQDGLESALSPYSPIAFPPSIIDRGAAQTDNLLATTSVSYESQRRTQRSHLSRYWPDRGTA